MEKCEKRNHNEASKEHWKVRFQHEMLQRSFAENEVMKWNNWVVHYESVARCRHHSFLSIQASHTHTMRCSHTAQSAHTLHLIFAKNKFGSNVATNQAIALSLLNVIIRWNWKAKQAIDKIYVYIAHMVWGVKQRKKNKPTADNVTSASLSVHHPERTFALYAKIESSWRHT